MITIFKQNSTKYGCGESTSNVSIYLAPGEKLTTEKIDELGEKYGLHPNSISMSAWRNGLGKYSDKQILKEMNETFSESQRKPMLRDSNFVDESNHNDKFIPRRR
jgi:hypothetical protein